MTLELKNMKLVVMQPYLFPYYGYFQLIHACDIFVIYDDVNFIKQGYINRNRLLDGRWFTFHLQKASPNKLINQIYLDGMSKKFMKTIHQIYQKAPYYPQVAKLLNKILDTNDFILANFVEKSIRLITEYIGLNKNFLISSNIPKDNSKKGKYKLYDICKQLNASVYINSCGGRHLYDQHEFIDCGITLKFINSQPVEYKQFLQPFTPNLSIIDVLMFNNPEETIKLLEKYELQ